MDGLLLLTVAVSGAAVFAAAQLAQSRFGATQRMVQRRTLVAQGLAAADVMPTGGRLLFTPPAIYLSERARRTAQQLERAGWAIKVGEYNALRVATLVLCVAAAVIVAGMFDLGTAPKLALFFGGAFAGLVLPGRYVLWRTNKRLKAIESQLEDTLVSITKSLRAGLGLLQALDYAADEASPPLGPELKRSIRDLQMGADAEVVFEELNHRVGSPELEIMTTAIIIQRRVGGNLSEILSNVATTLRERRQIFRDLDVMTSRQKLTANLVALLPVAVASFFFMVNPDVANLLITTTAGRIALAVGIFFEVAGLYIIRRLAVIEV